MDWMKLNEKGGFDSPNPVPPGIYVVEVEEGIERPHIVQITLHHDKLRGWLERGGRKYFNPVVKFIRCKKVGNLPKRVL